MKFVDFTGLFEGARPPTSRCSRRVPVRPRLLRAAAAAVPGPGEARGGSRSSWTPDSGPDSSAKTPRRGTSTGDTWSCPFVGRAESSTRNSTSWSPKPVAWCSAGSNNLTRSGCTANLELLNSVPVARDGGEWWAVRLAQEAYAFFLRVRRGRGTDRADRTAVARRTGQTTPWIAAPPVSGAGDGPRLLHTHQGKLWDRIEAAIGNKPNRITVISPFYDTDAAMVLRVRSRWPKCRVELVAQQHYTTLPVAPLKQLRGRPWASMS